MGGPAPFKPINKNLEQQAQALFKEWFVDNANPNWNQGKLEDFCSYQKNRTNISNLNESNYLSTENMLPNKMGFQPAATLPTSGQFPLIEPGNVLVSNIRPYFKKIVFADFEGGCSADVLNFVAKEEKYTYFMYQILFDDNFFEYMMAGSKGTKMPRGDKQQIMAYDICIPDDKDLEKFNTLLKPMIDQVISNRKETQTLAQLRDTLLPKLITGELNCV